MSVKQINTKALLRNDTSANWYTNNPVLGAGEIGIEKDTNKIKIGNGSTAWNSLPYAPTINYASDTVAGIIKVNSSKGIGISNDGVLTLPELPGSMNNSTGMYVPNTIHPAAVGNGSFLITEASGTTLGSKSLGVTTGIGVTLKTKATPGTTQYVVANTYVNRIHAAAAVGATVARDEASAATDYTVVTSVQINGASFTPDSSPNDSSNNIIITTQESINPDTTISSLRLYLLGSGFSNLYVGQSVGGKGGASVVVGQRVFSASGNACALIGADIWNNGNGNAVFGRQHLSKKNRWFIAGTGHDNADGQNECGTALGQWSKITSQTRFVIGDGTDHVTRSNLFEVRGDGSVVLKSPNGNLWAVSVDNSGNIITTATT